MNVLIKEESKTAKRVQGKKDFIFIKKDHLTFSSNHKMVFQTTDTKSRKKFSTITSFDTKNLSNCDLKTDMERFTYAIDYSYETH